MQSLSASPSVTHLKLPGAEGGGSGTAAADVRAGPGPLKPGRIPDRESRAQRGLHKPLPAQEDPASRACACSEKDLPSATAPARGVILRLRAIGGGRGQQGGRCGRKEDKTQQKYLHFRAWAQVTWQPLDSFKDEPRAACELGKGSLDVSELPARA